MKKNELKKILKPLIKECIKECIFEEGVLSGIITEVVSGMANQRIVAEGLTITKQEKPEPAPQGTRDLEEKMEKQRQERIRRLNESFKFDNNVDVFEGTKPTLPENSSPGPLSGVQSTAAGVNIDGILDLAAGKWKHLI